MLYEITVYKENGEKRQRIYSAEITAKDVINAVEKACIRLGPKRMVEIREIDGFPKVNRIERDGVI